MRIAIAYLGPMGCGATRPQLFRADDGKVYVVKLQSNRLGPKVLANEALAAALGRHLQLPFPPSGVIRIAATALAGSRKGVGDRITAGLHFASEFLPRCKYVCRHNLSKAQNKTEMAGVILFDHLLNNLDRTLNRKNLLLHPEGAGYKLYAIDNTHLFKRGKWAAGDLYRQRDEIKVNYRRTFGWLLKYFLTPDDFAPYVARVKGLSDADIAAAVDAIPLEWLPDQNEREVLAEFIGYRRDLAEKVADRLTALIPSGVSYRREV